MKKTTLHVIGSFALGLLALQSMAQSTNDSFDPNADGPVSAVAVQADGKLIIGGYFATIGGYARSRLARLNVDGSVDIAFNIGATGEPGATVGIDSLAVQPDGKILVGGFFTRLGNQPRRNLGRLNRDGTVDPTFDPQVGPACCGPMVLDLCLQADGKILVGGSFSMVGGEARPGIARLNADGSLDTGFNPQGTSAEVYSLAVQADRKILVAGYVYRLAGQPRIGIGRLNADGTLDTTFDPAPDGHVFSLAVQPDGKILAGGYFGRMAGGARTNIARLNANGSLDTTFSPAAKGDFPGIRRVLLQLDGRVLVAGGFKTLDDEPRTGFGRLNSNGSVDTSFSPSVDNLVRCTGLQADGKILVGGSFTVLNGQTRNYIGRLASDGTPPRILTQPFNYTVPAGGSASFRVSAVGTPPLAYQWRFNRAAIPGATSNSYTRSFAQTNHSGIYDVVVSNAFGSITSAGAALTVTPPLFTLETMVRGGGTVLQIPGLALFGSNAPVTLVATPTAGWSFSGWSGQAKGLDNPVNVIMTTNKVITADFVPSVLDVIVDNLEASFTGPWTTDATSSFRYAVNYRFANTVTNRAPTATAIFTPAIPHTGFYDVYTWSTQIPGRSFRAPILVSHDGSDDLVSTSLTGPGRWVAVVTNKHFAAGMNGFVRLSNDTGEPNSVVVADAVRFVWSAGQPVVPILAGINVSGGTAEISWYSEPGRTYRVEYKTNIRDTAWQSLALSEALATGPFSTKMDSTLGATHQRFYRVVQVP